MKLKKYGLTIRGKHKEWNFTTWVDPKYVPEWREDGIIIEKIVNTIPAWVARLGLVRVWCFFEDLLTSN